MTEYTYYIDSEDGLLAFDYYDIMRMINDGTFGLSKEVLIYDPISHYKKECKLKELL